MINKLEQMGLVTEPFAKQARKVIPKSIDDVANEVIQLLAKNGISTDDIAKVITSRNGAETPLADSVDEEGD